MSKRRLASAGVALAGGLGLLALVVFGHAPSDERQFVPRDSMSPPRRPPMLRGSATEPTPPSQGPTRVRGGPWIKVVDQEGLAIQGATVDVLARGAVDAGRTAEFMTDAAGRVPEPPDSTAEAFWVRVAHPGFAAHELHVDHDGEETVQLQQGCEVVLEIAGLSSPEARVKTVLHGSAPGWIDWSSARPSVTRSAGGSFTVLEVDGYELVSPRIRHQLPEWGVARIRLQVQKRRPCDLVIRVGSAFRSGLVRVIRTPHGATAAQYSLQRGVEEEFRFSTSVPGRYHFFCESASGVAAAAAILQPGPNVLTLEPAPASTLLVDLPVQSPATEVRCYVIDPPMANGTQESSAVTFEPPFDLGQGRYTFASPFVLPPAGPPTRQVQIPSGVHRVRVSGLPAGSRVLVLAMAANVGIIHSRLVRCLAPPATTEVVFLRAPIVDVQLLNAAEVPPAGWALFVRAMGGRGLGSPGQDLGAIVVWSSKISLLGLAPSSAYQLTVLGAGTHGEAEFDTTADAEVRVHLEHGPGEESVRRVQLTDELGEPMPRCRLRIDAYPWMSSYVKTDEHGIAQIILPLELEAWAVFESSGRTTVQARLIPSGELSVLRSVRLAKLSVHWSRDEMVDVALHQRRGGDLLLVRHLQFRAHAGSRTEFDHLEPGGYELTIGGAQTVDQTEVVYLLAGETTAISR